MDSIVNFGEQLPDHELTKAFNGADKVSVWQQGGGGRRLELGTYRLYTVHFGARVATSCRDVQ